MRVPDNCARNQWRIDISGEKVAFKASNRAEGIKNGDSLSLFFLIFWMNRTREFIGPVTNPGQVAF